MGKKMGRPPKNEKPRKASLHLRMTEEEIKRITRCAEKFGISRTETLMRGIALLEQKG